MLRRLVEEQKTPSKLAMYKLQVIEERLAVERLILPEQLLPIQAQRSPRDRPQSGGYSPESKLIYAPEAIRFVISTASSNAAVA